MRDRDLVAKIRRKIIGLDENGGENKLSIKYSKITHSNVEDTIDHKQSIHSLSLQNSDYLCIEHKQEKIVNLLAQDKNQEKQWDDDDA